jgi:hypothetical protein
LLKIINALWGSWKQAICINVSNIYISCLLLILIFLQLASSTVPNSTHPAGTPQDQILPPHRNSLGPTGIEGEGNDADTVQHRIQVLMKDELKNLLEVSNADVAGITKHTKNSEFLTSGYINGADIYTWGWCQCFFKCQVISILRDMLSMRLCAL